MQNYVDLACAAFRSGSGLGGLIDDSSPMHRIDELIGEVRLRSSQRLIFGETVTRKELTARTIHFAGLRPEKTLVHIDCSALASTPIESGLFERGTSTFLGADNSRFVLFQTSSSGCAL